MKEKIYMTEEAFRKAMELSAKRQTDRPSFCGVSLKEHNAFMDGFRAGYKQREKEMRETLINKLKETKS